MHSNRDNLPSSASADGRPTGTAADHPTSLRGFASGRAPDRETAKRTRKRHGGTGGLGALRRRGARGIIAFLSCALALGAAPYRNDFSGAKPGPLPEGLQRINGDFTVARAEGNTFLELPGDPLDTFGVLFGPAEHAEVDVSARAWSKTSGRRYPEFGVGAGDIGGFKLMLLPAQKKLELRKNDHVVATGPYEADWKSGTWTTIRLRVTKAGNGWKVEGKAWPSDAEEPEKAAVSLDVTEAPQPGRASIWAVPFSGQSIRFDDLSATPATP